MKKGKKMGRGKGRGGGGKNEIKTFYLRFNTLQVLNEGREGDIDKGDKEGWGRGGRGKRNDGDRGKKKDEGDGRRKNVFYYV